MTLADITAAQLVSADGTLVHLPYRIASHGFVVTRPNLEAAVVILPITAAEDPRFGPYLNQNGLYRIEDRSGRIARIGQGRILDRVRRHRAKPVAYPHRLIAAVPLGACWSVAQRCYLEAQLADSWLAEGHALASSLFIREYPTLAVSQRAEMDQVFLGLRLLISSGLHLGEPGNPLGFEEVGSCETSAFPRRGSTWFRRFPPGTWLEYRDANIHAQAVARRSGDVLLLPASLVYLNTSMSVGRSFVAHHRQFLAEAGVVDLGDGVGRTRHPVTAKTAAALIKRVTAGRIHNADKWRPTEADTPVRERGSDR